MGRCCLRERETDRIEVGGERLRDHDRLRQEEDGHGEEDRDELPDRHERHDGSRVAE